MAEEGTHRGTSKVWITRVGSGDRELCGADTGSPDDYVVLVGLVQPGGDQGVQVSVVVRGGGVVREGGGGGAVVARARYLPVLTEGVRRGG